MREVEPAEPSRGGAVAGTCDNADSVQGLSTADGRQRWDWHPAYTRTVSPAAIRSG